MKQRSFMRLIVFLLAGAFLSTMAQAHEPQTKRDCSAYSYAPPFPSAPAGYVPRYHTIAHQFLDDERNVGPVTVSEYSILDSLLDEAQQRLRPIPADLSGAAYDQFAENSLKTIDCILVRHGFVYPGKGLVQLLSDGLDSAMFTDTTFLDALLTHRHNAGRTEFIRKRKTGPFYVVDCDIASYLYLAIGEIMKYPLSMVDLPTHNFVRWSRPDGSYLDFETMDGILTNDNYYYAIWGIPQRFVGIPGVMTTMTKTQLVAYHFFTLGVAITWKGDYPGLIATYEKAISIDATLNDSANNLAWFYSVVPNVQLRDGKKAVEYAEKAVAILANGDIVDTLACAYGTAEQFQEAVASEQRAIMIGWTPQESNLQGDLTRLQAGQTCEDPMFGKDPRPFRQTAQPVIVNLPSKAANVSH